MRTRFNKEEEEQQGTRKDDGKKILKSRTYNTCCTLFVSKIANVCVVVKP